MGKFESYPEANTLNDDDITLYNKNTVTHKINFATLVSLIRSKLEAIGFVSSVSAGAGLSGGTITSSGTLKCNLKSETLSSLTATNMGSTANRQYAVGLDSNGHLSVNVPWAGSTYNVVSKGVDGLCPALPNETSTTKFLRQDGTWVAPSSGGSYSGTNGVKLVGTNFEADIASATKSSLEAIGMGVTSNRQYAVGLDKNGKLSVNIPWKNTTYNTVSKGTNGLCPALPNETSTSKFLRQDGTWTIPPNDNTQYNAQSGVRLSSGNYFEADMKTYTKSTLEAASMGSTPNRQYAVGLDKYGKLSVNIPWENTTYSTVTKSANGLCPALPNETSTTKFLRQDGTWVIPPNDNTQYNAQNGVKLSSGNYFEADIKSTTKSTLEAASMGSTANRQYAVGLDKNGKLSVNIPWENTTYGIVTKSTNGLCPALPNETSTTKFLRQDGTWVTPPDTQYNAQNGVKLVSGNFEADIKSTTKSTLEATNMGSTANRQYAVGLDKNGKLSVNIPWANTTYDGDNGIILNGNTFEANLITYVKSTLETSDVIYDKAGRQYSVGLDAHGKLSVNVPWVNTTYAQGTGITISGDNNTIKVKLNNTHTSTSTTTAATANSVKVVYDESMRRDGSNSSNLVTFADKFVVGTTTEHTGQKNASIGLDNTINGYYALAVGSHTKAVGQGSIAIGTYTQSNADYTHAEGYGGSGTINIGTTDINTNLFTQNVYNIYASMLGAHAEGAVTAGSGLCSGTIQANGGGSYAMGYVDSSATSAGLIIAKDDGAHAEGYASSNDYILAGGLGAHAEGKNTKATGYNGAHAEGDTTTASGYGAHSEGGQTIASGNYSHAEGYQSQATQSYSHAEGNSTTASGQYSHAEGKQTQSIGNVSHTEGEATIARGYYSHAEGYNSTTDTNAQAAHAEGYYSAVTGDCSHAEGFYTQANGTNSHAEGTRAIASGNSSHAEGADNTASGNYSHAEGANNTSSGTYTHTEGTDNTASAISSHAEGAHNTASASSAHAEGASNTASGTYAHVEGYGNIASGDSAHAEGKLNVADYDYAHAEGFHTEAHGYGCHTEGYGSSYGSINFGTNNIPSNAYDHSTVHSILAKAWGSHAEGAVLTSTPSGSDVSYCGAIQAMSMGSHAEGYVDSSASSQAAGLIVASGFGAHVEGYSSPSSYMKASGKGAHAEGGDNKVENDFAHAEGYQNLVNGESSHVEGYKNTVRAHYAHAEGYNNTLTNASDSTWASHAEGYNNTVSNSCAHAEGQGNTASGTSSHAEGSYNTASASASHAEGMSNHANTDYSHAGGAYATTYEPCQLVQGGNSPKFGAFSTYGRGMFSISPNARYYNADTTLTTSINGDSGTVKEGVSITLTLDKYAMYMLYWTTYSGTNDANMSSGMHLISTSATTNNPCVQDILSGNIIDDVGACSITLLDSAKYMFHLIRII